MSPGSVVKRELENYWLVPVRVAEAITYETCCALSLGLLFVLVGLSN